MSDEKSDAPIKRISDHVPKSRRNAAARAAAAEAEEKRKEEAEAQRPAKVGEVRHWITAGALAAAGKAYRELAAEHQKIFEMQEAAFMAIIEGMHARVCVLEESQGIASPAIATLREAFGAAITAYQNGDEEPGPMSMEEAERRGGGITEFARGEPGDDLSGRAEITLDEQARFTDDQIDQIVAEHPIERLDEQRHPVVEMQRTDAQVVAAVRETLGERWNTLSLDQRREAVRVWIENGGGRVIPADLSDRTVQ